MLNVAQEVFDFDKFNTLIYTGNSEKKQQKMRIKKKIRVPCWVVEHKF